MSWATEDWTAGLSGRVLQRVQEIQSLNDKLNRERQQRQLQLDNSETALHKQKQKYEEVRVELAAVKRELLGMQDLVQVEARARERLAQELQAKVAQVCSLQGQLDAQKSQSQNLALEVKRLEAELEKLQKESVSGDTMLFSTPCWTMNSPWEQSGKTGLGVEGDNRACNIRHQLQFGDTPKASASAVSSSFPQQPHTPPPGRRVHQSDTRTPSAMFPWERDDTRSTFKGRPTPSPAPSSFSFSNASDTGLRDDRVEEALRKEIDGLRVRSSGLQQELQLEKECRRETESRLVKAQKDVTTNEQNLTRSKDELARAQTRITQEGDRAQAAEQRVKQLQEELKCQRQNAETSRCNAEQRRKEMEKEHQRERLELQKERQSIEKQHQQETNKLNQEIQQARTLHNALQTQYDKLVLQKQAAEKDLDEVRGRLKNTQADLTETQKRETQLQAKLMESLRENDGLRVSLEQLKKREKSLEEEVKRLTEELADALKLIKELQAKLAAPPPQVVTHSFTGDGFSSARTIHTDQSPPRHHSVQRKRGTKPERPKGPDRPELVTNPSGREPGEGIDSEHISEFDTHVLEGTHHGTGRSGESEIDSSITEQDTGIEDTDTDSYMSDSVSERIFKEEFNCESEGTKGSSLSQRQKRDPSAAVQLKKENAILQDELKDIKKELQQRLEDLESQRRAETEARTKLKQLSKKYSSQNEQHRTKAQELKEKESKLEAQLELERMESATLKEVVTSLEKEAEKRKEESKREEEEKTEVTFQLQEALAELERKREELKNEKENMHKELEELQSVLLQERNKWEREREEEKKMPRSNEMERLKIAELQAELDRLQNSCIKEDNSVKDNMPLTYLQLGNQANTTNDATSVTNTVMCESENLQNTLLSDKTVSSLITECELGTKSVVHASVEQSRPSEMSLEQQKQTTEISELDNTTVLVLEVERLRVQRDKEAERAKTSQKKLEALQNQVNNQTKQLTLAFENQSKNIEGLLKGLQEKDAALERQGRELQSCLEELAVLKSEKQMTELSNKSSNTEQHGEVSLDPDCSSVISECTPSTDEVPKQDDSHSVNEDSRQSDNQNFPNSENKKTELGNCIDDMDCLILSTHGGVSLDFINGDEHSAAQKLPELLTIAQQGTDETLQPNTVYTESSVINPDKPKNPLEIPQSVLENHPDDLSALKLVINELQNTKNELAILKAKNEFATQDYLAIKQENELLKLKLKPVETEPSLAEEPPRMQDGSPLTNTNKEGSLTENQSGHLGDSSSSLNEKPRISSCSEDQARDIRDDEENATEQKTLEPLTTAQEGIGDHNIVDTETLSPDKLKNILENQKHDLNPIIDELHKTQNELVILKDENDRLTRQLQEFSTQDYLAVKQENEHLKLKLKQMDKEPCLAEEPLQMQDGSHLAITNKEKCLDIGWKDKEGDIRTEQVDEENVAAQKLPEPMTTPQIGTGELVNHQNPSEITGDLTLAIDEPHETQNELAIVKDKYDRLTLQLQEFSTQHYQATKQENELLKIKLKQMETKLHSAEEPSQSQDDSELTNTNKETCSAENQAGLLVDVSSSLNEKPSISVEDEAGDVTTKQEGNNNAPAPKLQEPLTTAQEGTGETDHNKTDKESSIMNPDMLKNQTEILQSLLENHPDHLNALKHVIDELQETKNELAILKDRNDQLTLELQEPVTTAQEGSGKTVHHDTVDTESSIIKSDKLNASEILQGHTVDKTQNELVILKDHDYLAIKQENEQLKLKRKQLDTEPCLAEEPSQMHDRTLLTNANKEKCLGDNQTGHLVDVSSSLNEKPIISVSEDEAMRTEQEDEENASAQKLQEPLTTAQEGTGETVDPNTVNTESSILSPEKSLNPLEILQSVLENHPDHLNALKHVIDDLHYTQNELAILKAKYDQQTLQLKELSSHDCPAIKEENEHLELKLLETEPCLTEPSQMQDAQRMNTNKEKCLDIGQNGKGGDIRSKLGNDENAAAQKLHEPLTTAQKVPGETVFTESSIISPDHSLNQSEILHEKSLIINELAILKGKNDQLTLQLQEVYTHDYLAIKQENENLKLKLELMDTKPCFESLQTQDIPQLANTNKVKCLAENQVDASSNPRFGTSSEDEARDTGDTEREDLHEKIENKTWPSQQDHTLQEQLQVLQTQLQVLAEKNEQLAEELELWRISALSPGETMDQQSSNNPIVLVQEGQLVLSCSPTVLHTSSKQSRNMEHLEGYSDHQRDKKGFSEQTTADLQPILKATEPMAIDDGAITDVNVHVKMEIRTMGSCCTISSFKADNSDDDRTSTDQIKRTGRTRDAQVAENAVNLPQENAFLLESQNGSSTRLKTEECDPKLETEPADRRDVRMSSFSENNSVTQCLVGDQDQRSDFCDVTFGPYQTVTMNPGCPRQSTSFVDASTQTDSDQMIEKKKYDSDVTDSPPVSPNPASETEKLLFSGSFPIPANPAHLAERIRRNRSRMSAAHDDTEYEPYGLPEVVMKGFADIPSGPACPYVLRRGLLGTDALPVSLREPLLKEEDEDIDP